MKRMCYPRFLIPALIALVGLAQGSVVFGETAPVGDAAYPPFGTCSSQTPPTLPPAWQASVLLTPFQNQELQVAKVSYDSGLNAMRVTTRGLDTGTFHDLLVIGSTLYSITSSGGDLVCNLAPNVRRWKVPARDWLSGKGCKCEGSNKVVGKDADAWACPDGQHDGGGPVVDWFWFTKDRNRFPWRFLTSRQGVNAQHFPVLGNASMAHLPLFDPSPSPYLQAVVDLCENGRATSARGQRPLIPGIGGCGSIQLPTWPNQAFGNGALFDHNGDYMNMAIYYDWTAMQESSKIKTSLHSPVTEEQLTRGITHTVTINRDGSYSCTPAGVIEGVGIWHPNWPTLDGCQCKATFASGSPLNPWKTEVQAISCHFGGSAYIQAWYTTAGTPKMFYETNAGALDLIDYDEWLVDPAIPTGVFFDPPKCEKMTGPPVTVCSKCHTEMGT